MLFSVKISYYNERRMPYRRCAMSRIFTTTTLSDVVKSLTPKQVASEDIDWGMFAPNYFKQTPTSTSRLPAFIFIEQVDEGGKPLEYVYNEQLDVANCTTIIAATPNNLIMFNRVFRRDAVIPFKYVIVRKSDSDRIDESICPVIYDTELFDKCIKTLTLDTKSMCDLFQPLFGNTLLESVSTVDVCKLREELDCMFDTALNECRAFIGEIMSADPDTVLNIKLKYNIYRMLVDAVMELRTQVYAYIAHNTPTSVTIHGLVKLGDTAKVVLRLANCAQTPNTIISVYYVLERLLTSYLGNNIMATSIAKALSTEFLSVVNAAEKDVCYARILPQPLEEDSDD